MHRFLSDWLFLGVFFFIFFTPSLQSRETQKIPRILHWAHPDSSPLSKEEIKSIKSWQKLHPKWRFKLWTNAPCTLKSVEICKSAFLNSDLESLKKAILQKEGGIFIDIGLIGCKTLEKLSLTGTPFQTSDGHSIIGCRPNQVDAPRKTLPEGFILPDQIFTTQLFPSPFVGGCFRRFNTLPRLTDELRKIQAANAEAEITAKLLSKKFTKIKWFFFPTLLLCFLNCFLLIQTFSHLVSFFKSKRGCALLALLFLIGTFFAWERPPRSIKGNTNHYLSLFNFAQYTDKIPESDLKYLEIYRSLFDQKFLSLTQRENREQIPHLIHFIWGGPPFPETSIRNIVSWMECHPEWTFYFWTDDPNRPVPVKGMIKRLFSELLFSSPIRSYFEKAENWGEKSDLLRYEILSREGGLYVDHDVECLHSFAPLHTSVSFYASAEPLHNSALYNSHLTVSNCLIGSVPNHPILSDTLRLSFERWDLGSQMFPDQDKLSNLLRTLFRTFSPLDETIR
ncbi:MAG TPA: glycosyltransferase, partial [Chlamydiales bacterium]|nr:glycosyltransferase [Chlamydiales bacterium]